MEIRSRSPMEPVSGQEVHLVDTDDDFLLVDLTLHAQDVPEPGGRGAFPPFFPPGAEPPKRPAVDCKPGPVPACGRPRAGEDHSSRRCIAAPLERSYPDARDRVSRRDCFGRVTLDSVPIRACSGRGLPRRRSPGCRAWALTPRFQPCLCLHVAALRRLCFAGHRRCGFCCAFPRVAPGRR